VGVVLWLLMMAVVLVIRLLGLLLRLGFGVGAVVWEVVVEAVT